MEDDSLDEMNGSGFLYPQACLLGLGFVRCYQLEYRVQGPSIPAPATMLWRGRLRLNVPDPVAHLPMYTLM